MTPIIELDTPRLRLRQWRAADPDGLRNANQDFEHPGVPEGHALRRHCLYRITAEEWQA